VLDHRIDPKPLNMATVRNNPESSYDFMQALRKLRS
jgi:hypothetical protein